DDYLVLAPHDPEVVRRIGRLVAVADGMGGAMGGAEASRAALRALAAEFLTPPSAGTVAPAHMRAGFAAACRRVLELARESPALAGMGTTLTAVHLCGERMVVGHVGDSRCYRLRDGRFEQLTTDHAVRGENRLTRCIGAGRDHEDVDVAEHDLRPGDRLLL